MGDVLIILLTAVGGMLCGAAVIGLMVFAYLRVGSTLSASAIPIFTPASDLSAAPPPPILRPYLENEELVTIPPHEQSGLPTFEHDNNPNDGRPWLDGIGGMVAGQRIKLTRTENVIGRSRVCDVQFHDPKVSRQHAMIRLYQGRYFIQDMQSSRGTIVNERRVETHLLQDGDKIRLGDSLVVFRVPTVSY